MGVESRPSILCLMLQSFPVPQSLFMLNWAYCVNLTYKIEFTESSNVFIFARWSIIVSTYSYKYRPQRSCGQGYVFTRVCNSVRGGSVSVHAGIPPWEQTPRADPPGSRHPQSRHPPRSRHPPKADSSIRSMSDRYASYCNAFLLYCNFSFGICIFVLNATENV